VLLPSYQAKAGLSLRQLAQTIGGGLPLVAAGTGEVLLRAEQPLRN
jgi:hypothetical protein